MTPESPERQQGPLGPWLEELGERAQMREHTFTSERPLVGRLIARFRALWNGVATRWYVQPLIEQQSDFNSITLQALRQLDASHQDLIRELGALRGELGALRGEFGALCQELSDRLVEGDRDQSELARRVAELTIVLVRLERRAAAGRAPGDPPSAGEG